MTLGELNQLIAAGESETLELKKSTGQRSRAMETLCAMLNGKGGTVVFGVTPDGRVVGQQVETRTMERVHAELAKISPIPAPDIEQLALPGTDRCVLVVTVPGRTGLYTYDDRAYIRRGPMTIRMPKPLYNRLLLDAGHGTNRWERLAARDVGIEDLDAAQIVRTVEDAIRRERLNDPGTRDIAELLIGMGLLRDAQLTNAAVVLFGERRCFRGDYIQCVLKLARFQGTDKSEFLDNRQVHGNAFELFVAAQRFWMDHLPI